MDTGGGGGSVAFLSGRIVVVLLRNVGCTGSGDSVGWCGGGTSR